MIERAQPKLSMEHILSAVRAAQKYANQNGVTSVQDMGVFTAQGVDTMVDVIRAYQILEGQADLTVRVSDAHPAARLEALCRDGGSR